MRSATATSCLKLNTKKLVSQLETSLKPSSVSPGGGFGTQSGRFQTVSPPYGQLRPGQCRDVWPIVVVVAVVE